MNEGNQRSVTTRIAAFLILLLFSVVAHGLNLVGVGYADNREKAVHSAYTDLAQQLFVRVESRTEVEQTLEESSFAQRSIAETDIPLLQVPVSCQKRGGEYECRAAFNSSDAHLIYKDAIEKAERSIQQDYRRFQTAQGAPQYTIGKSLLASLSNYRKLLRVAGFLELDSSFDTGEIESAIDRWYASARFNVTSLSGAAQLILDDLNQSRVVIKPPFPPDSQELTPFGRVFLKELETQLGDRLDNNEPLYELIGTYSVGETGMDISYELVELRSNDTLQVKRVHLAGSAYKGYETEPSSVDFDRLLRKGFAVSGDFSVAVATNKGMRNLAFGAGDTVELLVKLNRPGYFYVVGYSQEDASEFQYLLPVAYGSGNEQFIQYVSAEQANRWVSLGEFEVAAPFGTERLQVFAAEDNLLDSLPQHYYDADSGYYLVGARSDVGASGRTRGLKRIREETKAKAESALIFSTYE